MLGFQNLYKTPVLVCIFDGSIVPLLWVKRTQDLLQLFFPLANERKDDFNRHPKAVALGSL